MSSTRLRQRLPAIMNAPSEEALPDAVYRDLLSPLFTMTVPVIGFGILYVCVGTLIYLTWQDPLIAILTGSAAGITILRVLLIRSFHRAGGSLQSRESLRKWERRYTLQAYVFALLLAGLNVRALEAHTPLVHMATISLVFTFGAGIVSRNASRPLYCFLSISLAVVPTAIATLAHAIGEQIEPLHAQFFALEALLLVSVWVMSLASVRHLYASSLDHLMSKHDLALLARFDPLTGLPNRLLLRETFLEGLASSQRSSTQLAIHYLDLDGFKAINDRYGHPSGDRMLVEVSQRLKAIVRGQDVAVRLGGDEFLVVQTNVQHRAQAELLARRVIRQLSEPYLIEGCEMQVTVSIGIAMAPELGTEMERLIECADAALYRSKARGKAQIHFCEGTDGADGHQDVA